MAPFRRLTTRSAHLTGSQSGGREGRAGAVVAMVVVVVVAMVAMVVVCGGGRWKVGGGEWVVEGWRWVMVELVGVVALVWMVAMMVIGSGSQ